jgi:hypothetical protein
MLLHAREIQYDGTCPAAASAIIRPPATTCPDLADVPIAQKSAFEPLVDAAITAAIRRVLASAIRKASQLEGSPLSKWPPPPPAWAIYGAARQWSITPNRAPAEEIVPKILAFVSPYAATGQPTIQPALRLSRIALPDRLNLAPAQTSASQQKYRSSPISQRKLRRHPPPNPPHHSGRRQRVRVNHPKRRKNPPLPSNPAACRNKLPLHCQRQRRRPKH